MGVNNTLYDRPWLGQFAGLKPLYISGDLPPSVIKVSYEGRLQIHNGQGAMWAELVHGELPGGYDVQVDAATNEIVVTWPDYKKGGRTLPNGGFEGGEGHWSFGPGWSIATDNPETGTQCAKFLGASGVSQVLSPPVPAIPGSTTSLSVDFSVGTNGRGSVGARATIAWLGANKQLLYIPGVQEPENDIFTAGPTIDVGSPYQASSVSASVPLGAVYQQANVSVKRNRENKPAWADNVVFTYDTDAVGVRTPRVYEVTLRVHDSAGRSADWSGTIQVGYLNLTSQLYPVFVQDDEDSPLVTGGGVETLRMLAANIEESLVTGGSVVALTLTRTVTYGTYDHAQDDADSPLVTGGSVTALDMQQVVSYGEYDHVADDADSPLVTGGSVLALDMQVTTGYQTYDWTQDDTDSPVVTGGSVTQLSMTTV